MDTPALAQELAAFDAEVDRFESDYEAKAKGKAGIQKGMDSVRSLFNRGADGKGYGDDQWKNIANTQHGLDQLQADVQSGRLDGAQAQQALQQLRQSFHGEAERVDEAQAGNARVGHAVHGAGRIAAVSAAGVAGTVAGGGVNVVAGAAAALAAGSAYDALTVGAGQLDKTLGCGGSQHFAPTLDAKQSVGGLAANALTGQQTEAKDVVQAGVGTALDAVSGWGAGQGIRAVRAGIAAAKGSAQAASAAASASVKTGLQQNAATLVVQTAGTAIDPSLSAQQKQQQIVQQGQDSLTQLPGTLVFGAASSAAGVVVQPAHKLLDGAAQVALDGVSNVGDASVGNVLAGKGPALNAEQLAQAVVLGTSGALQNIAQRRPQGDTASAAASSAPARSGDAPDEHPPALPPAASVKAALPPARSDVSSGQRGGALESVADYPGPAGPWVGYNELGDTIHTMAALRALDTSGGSYGGKINVLSAGADEAGRMVDLFNRVFPRSTVVVHSPPKALGQTDAGTEHETFFRGVKANSADQPALGHPFDATRVLGQQQLRDATTVARVRQFVDGLVTPREKATVKQYLSSVEASLLDAGVAKAIVALRNSADGYGQARNSSPESLQQTIAALQQRGLRVVVMGAALPEMQLPPDAIDLTGHWRRVSDLPAQAHLFDQLARHNTQVAVGNMSGLLDLIHLSADIPVLEFGPAFRMKMWQEAFGADQFAVVEPAAYDATAADPALRRLDDGAMQQFESALDGMNRRRVQAPRRT